MPLGKPAGEMCIHLGQDNLCKLFGHVERPLICSSFKAEDFVCGNNAAEAAVNINFLENYTRS
jgi:hypothetical protein